MRRLIGRCLLWFIDPVARDRQRRALARFLSHNATGTRT